MTFLDTALDLASRGFHVFPLKPRDKMPAVAGGFKAATRDPEQIALWWKRNPDGNIGIACEASALCVVDCDHGLTCYEDFIAWRDRNGLPATYAVRSGRRPEFGVQMYYKGPVASSRWELDGCSGDIKSIGGLVVAPPSIHPDSGEAYAVLESLAIAPTPDVVKQLKQVVAERTNGGGIDTDNRNDEMCSFIGKVRKHTADMSEPECLVVCLQRNERYAKGPMPEEEVENIVSGQYRRYPDVGPDPVVTIGSKPEEKKITDWRERYLTFERVRDAKPVEFLIDGFLALDSITALAAPVGQRKSLIALNIAHALCTGEPLFDYFKVAARPSRVVYLCPEMGLSSFSMRLKQIGLDSHIGQNLFCQTMDEDSIKLTDLDEELPGAVVIIDTLTRFVEGDQNSAEDMSRFAKVVFGIKRRGATVLLLHHSLKGASNGLTLDSAMRGSTELAAFVTCCWATRLQDPDEPYQSPSLLVNVKQRDFESKPFEATCDKTCRMRIVGEPGQMVELKSKADADAKTALASILKDQPKMGINKLIAALKDAGHRKGQPWVTKARAAILGTGVTFSSS